jgi:hypothetical protein
MAHVMANFPQSRRLVVLRDSLLPPGRLDAKRFLPGRRRCSFTFFVDNFVKNCLPTVPKPRQYTLYDRLMNRQAEKNQYKSMSYTYSRALRLVSEGCCVTSATVWSSPYGACLPPFCQSA